VADRGPHGGIGVIDATGHPKRGDKTPGVTPPYGGQSGKIDNGVVAQHLRFTDPPWTRCRGWAPWRVARTKA